MQPVAPNQNLPGLTQSEIVVLEEKLHFQGNQGFLYCTRQCITHFAEDSIPYHPGEKACLDRCMNKVALGMAMAYVTKKEFERQLRSEQLPYQWMRDAAAGITPG